ncbi:N(6)-adenine-specific DNA methyltransferase 2 [Asbolus verrucosus]|uniref:N(6)-adenine-specific DNA methyltransferase 2 n=1 Tax=Asbolus verrucosus TaxID=1661398 RepID=A0A482VZ87_ASBVE|nr:N(6)-adenine-specific DNA methyltransferase 2 [Asbolus verrucosus]
MTESDDDVPQLSANTFLALQEFYKEQEERDKRLLLSPNESITLDEDWQLSQFWYDEKTVQALVKIALNSVGENGKIALISCPTLYKTLKEKIGNMGEGAIMESLTERLLDVRKTSLKPQHKNNLANEFCCYSNFDIENLS